MRVDLLAPPFRGHLHPILAIAAELAPAHRVRVLSTPAATAEIAACDLEGHALLDASDDAALERISNPARAVGGNPLGLARQFRATLEVLGRARDALDALYADARERPDLLIADFTLPVAGPVAARHGLRWWTSLPSPSVLETRHGPPAYFGGLEPMDGLAGRCRDGTARLATRAFKRTVARAQRARLAALGLERVYRADGTEAAYSPERILALGLESFELGRGWPAAVRFVGPRLATPPLAASPPPFREGRRHVLVTCGTHLAHARGRFAAEALALARASPGIEVHLSEGRPPRTGRGAAPDGADAAVPVAAGRRAPGDPGNLVRLPWVDYARHVRRYALVIHHGGAGILWRCLADAVPAAVVPIDYDQPDNAVRLRRAGLAVESRPDEPLSRAVARALGDAGLADRCRERAAAIERARATEAIRALVDDLDVRRKEGGEVREAVRAATRPMRER